MYPVHIIINGFSISLYKLLRSALMSYAANASIISGIVMLCVSSVLSSRIS